MVPGSVIRAGSGKVGRRQEIIDQREISAHRMRRGVRCERMRGVRSVMSMEASVMSRRIAPIGVDAEAGRRDAVAVVRREESR